MRQRDRIYTIIMHNITLCTYVVYRGRRASVTAAARYIIHTVINNSATPSVNGVTATETLFTTSTQPAQSGIMKYYYIYIYYVHLHAQLHKHDVGGNIRFPEKIINVTTCASRCIII